MKNRRLLNAAKFLAFSLAAFLFETAILGQEAKGPVTGEPTVSRSEAELLRQAEEASAKDLSEAILLLREKIDDKSSPALDFALGCFLYEQGETEEALRSFRQALKKMPRFVRARENLARILLQEEEYGQASRELVILLEEDSLDKREPWKLLGYAYMAMERPEAAEVAFKNAYVLSPDDQELPFLIIRSLMDQEKYEEIRPLLRRELKKSPLREEIWKLYANTALSAGLNQEALVRLECAYRLGIAGAETLVTLGDLFLEQGLAAEALERFEKTAAMDRPPIARLLSALEGMIYQGNLAQAQAMFETLSSAQEEMNRDQGLKLRSLEAMLAEAEGDLEKALECYRALLEENPLDGKVLLAAGAILQKQEHHEDALIHFERAARVSPDLEKQALVRQALIWVDRADYPKAASLVERALEIGPEPYLERYLEQIRRMID